MGSQSREARNPESLIKLGIKYQERQDRDKALELFQRAAAMDPDGKIMMRRENGEIFSCLEMADFQYARTFMVTFGTIEHKRLDAFIKKHPSSSLVRDAFLEMTSRIYFTDEDGDAVYGPIAARFPHDFEIANHLAEQVYNYSQYVKDDRQDANLDRSLMLSENSLREAEAVSLPRGAQNLAQLQIMKGKPDKAEETYGRGFLAGQVKTWTEAAISYAEFWLKRKQNAEDAEKAVRLALGLSPTDPSLRRRAATLYLVPLEKMDKALDVYGPEFLKAIQSSPKDLYSYFSFWAERKTNEASAFEALEAILKLKPDSVYYRQSAASVLFKGGYRNRAMAVFGQEFIAGRQDDMNALYEYGIFWLQKNSNLDQAVPALVKSLRTIPKTYINQYSAARLLLKANKLDDALAIYGPAYLADIRNDASALSTYARFWLTEAKTNKGSALEVLEIAARITPLAEWDRNSIARLFLEAQKPDRAEAVYGAEYLKTIESDAEALIRYSSFWKFVNRNLFSALEAAQRASQIAPNNANAWGTLAEVNVASGNLKEALPAIEKACLLTKSKKDLEKYEALSKQIKAELEKIKK
jgi:tetratricopeptide (TPR) repeat protein